MSAAFVFLHIGAQWQFPDLLVRSIRAFHKDAEIIQCTDHDTLAIDGVDAVSRFDGDPKKLMTFRLGSFAALNRRDPAIYVDADMLCVQSLDPATILAGCDVAVCGREYGLSILINPEFRGMDFSEHGDKTFGQVYPYVACATISADGLFWADCLANLNALHPKFHRWYGDQEAIRNVVNSGRYRFTVLPESIYGFLPGEAFGRMPPRLLHFKGNDRKPAMFDYAKRLGLI